MRPIGLLELRLDLLHFVGVLLRVEAAAQNLEAKVDQIRIQRVGLAIVANRRDLAAAVRGAEGTDIPVTVKYRIGIDDDHHTHLEAGHIAESEGVAAVALHARTAAQRYSGTADWDEIARRRKTLAG